MFGLPFYLDRDLAKQQVCLFERDIGIGKERGRPGKDHQTRGALLDKRLQTAEGQGRELVDGKGADDVDPGQDRLGIPSRGQGQARDDVGIGAVARINQEDPLPLEGVEPRGKGRQREDYIGPSKQCDNPRWRGLDQGLNECRQPPVLGLRTGCSIVRDTQNYSLSPSSR